MTSIIPIRWEDYRGFAPRQWQHWDNKLVKAEQATGGSSKAVTCERSDRSTEPDTCAPGRQGWSLRKPRASDQETAPCRRAISIMDAPAIAPVTLPATGKACGSAVGGSTWTGHCTSRRRASIACRLTTRCPSTPRGLQRVDHEAIQQIMVACAISVRTSDSAPFISRLQQLHAGLYAGPLRDALGPG